MIPNRLAAALFFVFCISLLQGLHAVGPELQMSVGLDDAFMNGSVTQINVTVRSPDGPFSGTLVLEYSPGTSLDDAAPVIHRRTISLPAEMSAVYHFPMVLEAGVRPLEAHLESDGVIVAETSKDLRSMVHRRPIFIGLSRRPSLEAYGRYLSLALGDSIRLNYPRFEMLPIDSRVWNSAALVFWHDTNPSDLADAALDSLLLWVEDGGTLVVLDGPWNYGRKLPAEFPAAAAEESPKKYGRGKIYRFPHETNAESVVTLLAQEGSLERQTLHESEQNVESILARAAFDTDEWVFGPVTYPFAITVVFALFAVALLLVWRRAESAKLQVLCYGILILLSASAFVAASAGGKSYREGPEVLSLRIITESAVGPSRVTQHFRTYSHRSDSFALPISFGFLPIFSGGGWEISDSEEGLVLSGPGLLPWTPVNLVLESVVTGASDSNAGSEMNDPLLLVDGSAYLLEGHWKPGEPLPSRSHLGKIEPDELIAAAAESGQTFFGDNTGCYDRAAVAAAALVRGDEAMVLWWSRDETASSPDSRKDRLPTVPTGLRFHLFHGASL